MAEHQYKWLLKEVGKKKIREALLRMPPSRKGYPLNIAIFLSVRLPPKEELLPNCKEDPYLLPPKKVYPVRVSKGAMMRRFQEKFAMNGRKVELRKYHEYENGGRYYLADKETGKPTNNGPFTRNELEDFAKQIGIMEPYEIFDDTDPRKEPAKARK